MKNLLIETDAYHMTMGHLIRNPLEIETHVLYARTGGPQVVSDLSEILKEIVKSIPDIRQVDEAEEFWKQQRIPFPADAWRKIARMERLPLSVRGLLDGDVALPGDPIAVLTGPAALLGVIEPIIIGHQMTSLQCGTRFAQAAAATKWDTGRIFEVGLRAASDATDHIRKLAPQKRLGLRYTSSGAAAMALGLKAVGTMGHRFTQRFVGESADYEAFNSAIKEMIRYKTSEQISERLPLSFLLDTRSTLSSGLPAAICAIKDNIDAIKKHLSVGVRLDSGDMESQLKEIIRQFKAEFSESNYMPKIIIESGLTPENIARFERIAEDLGFDRAGISYGLGGYLVGGINRDAISLVYKITSFGGDNKSNTRDRTSTMKFGDEPNSGKESYPGDFDLWEKSIDGKIIRTIALVDEREQMRSQEHINLFYDLLRDGEVTVHSLRTDATVSDMAKMRWSEVAGDRVGDDKRSSGVFGYPSRPRISAGMARLIEKLRSEQFGENKGEVSCQ